MLWVVDGYTTTDQYPQSERDVVLRHDQRLRGASAGVRTLPTDQINYMRNAVKATVDAYTGQVTLYAWDETDPILQAWRSAFPGTVLDRDQIPSDLLPHLRYPEDMFKVQRYQYARYHVTTPRTSSPPTTSGRSRRTLDPQGPEPGADPDVHPRPDRRGSETWSLTSSYVPNNKTNLAGFVSAELRPDHARLRHDHRRAAARRERARARAGLQPADLRPADHPQDPVVPAR